jgi:hypothetical protein
MKSHKELTLKGFADLPDIRLTAALCSLTIEDCSKVKVQPKGMVEMKTLQGERDLVRNIPERERRSLLGTFQNGGSKASPAHGLRITILTVTFFSGCDDAHARPRRPTLNNTPPLLYVYKCVCLYVRGNVCVCVCVVCAFLRRQM